MDFKRANPAIIVHGGAGEWPRNKHSRALKGVEAAVRAGFEVLKHDGSARDAVEQAIVVLEDNPLFNAGTGSTMNLLGDIENDAAIMDGRDLESGAVALVRDVKNPIRLARIVMERTDHVLIAGLSARRLARAYGLARAEPIVPERLAGWKREKLKLKKGSLAHLSKNSMLQTSGFLPGLWDTVGALALDNLGDVSAGASTGGVTLKLPGRIGDSAIVGAGLYADDSLGAATATGIGELAIRTSISKATCDLMMNSTAQSAASKSIRMTRHRVGEGLGIITLDKKGRVGVSHTTSHLCWASDGKSGPMSGMGGAKI